VTDTFFGYPTGDDLVALKRLKAQPDRAVFTVDCKPVSREKAMEILAAWKERLK